MKVSFKWLTLVGLLAPSAFAAASQDSSKPIRQDLPLNEEAPAATASPVPEKGGFKLPSFDLESILASGPVASIFAKAGINVTERLAEAKKNAAETGWDPRIPLITDASFKSDIVAEPLTPEEEEQRVWFLVVSIPNHDPLATYVDECYDAAYNLTHSAPELALPHVRWGRINYIDVTEITTRWWIWQAPVLVVLRKRGKEMRFYGPRQIVLDPDVLHRFLEVSAWEQTDKWEGAFSPGGSLDYPMQLLSEVTAKGYTLLLTLPRWAFLMISGGLASFLVSWLHKQPPQPGRMSKAKQVKAAHQAKIQATNQAAGPSSTPSTPSKGSIKRRKKAA